MLCRFGNVVLMIAVLAATGAHWSVLQSIAWTRMLATNLSTCSFTEAVQKTFDGQHPCGLCKTIAAGKKAESKKEFTPPLQKFKFPPVSKNLALIVPMNFRLILLADTIGNFLTQQPPTPPPRGRLA